MRVINLKNYSSIRIGGEVKVKIIREISNLNGFFIIGGANNLIVCEDTKEQFAMLGNEFNYIKTIGDRLIVGGATPSGRLFSFCKRKNITNFEYLSKLPGKIGGLIKMNAGMKDSEIFNQLIEIKTIHGDISKDNIKYGYRFTDIQDVVFEATFKIEYGFNLDKVLLFKTMRENQPKGFSAGSCFKNPNGNYAGKLIEAVGLKGYKIGDLSFSNQHANFLINSGNGKFRDAIKLINLAKSRVFNEFGISLEEEVIIKE